MTRHHFTAGFCLLLLGLPGTLSAQQPAATTQPSALEVLKPYVGRWRINATWSGGAPLEARATYEWGLNKKFIVARTFIKQPDGSEYQRYENVFADDHGEVVCHNFTFTGEASVRTFTRDGAKLSSEWTAPGPQGEVKLRQSVELTDNDHIRWQVWQQREGKWEPMMDGKWERVTESGAK